MIVFLATPDQVSAHLILANYGRERTEHVTIPYGDWAGGKVRSNLSALNNLPNDSHDSQNV